MPTHKLIPAVNRREFLSQSGGGFAAIALAAMLSEEGLAAGE
jgi:hypothetical protein